jgi:lipopolysaccharide transport system permease protein
VIAQAREVYRYREAVRNMVARDLKVRYSNSVLGIVWALFSPLFMTLVYTVVFTVLIPGSIERFPVFVLAGLLPWGYFSSAVASTTGAITTNGHLINRVYFPREVLPVANIVSNGVNFVVALALLAGFIIVFRIELTMTVAWLPVLIIMQLMLMTGLGLFLSAVNVFFRDTQQIVDISMLAWFFLTPIIYPIDVIVNAALRQAVLIVNPMASLVVAYRQILFYGGSPDPALMAITFGQAALALVIGALVFRRLSPAFAEEV